MPHRHRVRDIAEQAHLSPATVDRVLHDRPGVSARARRAVERAVDDLDRQAEQVRLTGHHLVIDLVMQAPRRFTDLVRSALEAEMSQVRPVAMRLRPHLQETVDARVAGELLDRLRARGSDGVLLKAPDEPRVRQAVDALVEAGVPVVTMATDVRATRRQASVGLDHASAGRTAAYLLDRCVAADEGTVLVPLSRAAFFGEAARAGAFVEAIGRARPGWRVITIDGSDGDDAHLAERVETIAAGLRPSVVAVYSVGGGNRGVLRALDVAGAEVEGFVAHDLDDDNLDLLRRGRITAVLDHDLRLDSRLAVAAILQLRGLRAGSPVSIATPVGVVTPHNIPFRI